MAFGAEFEGPLQEFGIFILIPATAPWFNIVATCPTQDGPQSVDRQYYYVFFSEARFFP